MEEAITTVGDARGYPIERENYIAHLNNLHKPSYLFPKIPTAKDLKEKEDRKKRNYKRNGDASESSSKGSVLRLCFYFKGRSNNIAWV